METIFNYVKRRLRDVGPPEWEEIGNETGVAMSVPRKIAYERTGVVVKTVEPLYRYFLKRDYGICLLPHEKPPITKRGR
jgi:hypothetical protein